ncbi:hypothetical protein C7974DRAFT_351893 [Boeremia exigua]|uniref:uncharacterized protein n=1 Tax=Boeremia exigua TaxID=749465 RepID=UPI001E8D50C7|nr:uncharacterized protein C7974DRAFT_351893 [Boeremia exigua]KAH6642901.1 hypothetical protein C7974DRAFT_351893 [Boeremia exigua]
MPKPKKIPKTTSSPADPNEPSFLTTLPPEVRNAIYEALFKRDDPVLLHDADACYPRYPDPASYMADDDHMEQLEFYDEEIDENLESDHEFNHGLGGGLPLLLSCRQVYHESVGVLYGSNTFIITRALPCHDEYLNSSGCNEFNQINYAPVWLSGIGSQIDLLRQVLIDVGTTCFSLWRMEAVCKIKPLLILFWSYPELESKVEFSPTKGRVAHPVEATARPTNEARDRAELLNGIMKSLGTQDILNLKRYRHLNRLLGCISVFDGSKKLQVDFPATHSAVYKASNDGTSFRPCPRQPPENLLLILPKNVLCRICEFLKCSSLGIVADLNNRTVGGLDIRILQAVKFLRIGRSLLVSSLLAHPITVKASTTMAKTSFDDFSALRSFSDMVTDLFGYHGVFGDVLDEAIKLYPSSSLNMELHFGLCSNTALSELEVDIRGLLYLLCQAPSLKIQVSLTCSQKGKSYHEVLNVDVDSLNLNLFLVLLDIREQWPAGFRACENVTFDHICMDGRGSLKSVTCSKASGKRTFTYKNSFAHHTKERLQHLGYQRAMTYVNLSPSYAVFGRDQLGDELSSLHWKYWAHF